MVDHTKRILHVRDALFSGTNDRSITAIDFFPVRVAAGQYKDQVYTLYDVNGVPRLCKGVYLIVGGG